MKSKFRFSMVSPVLALLCALAPATLAKMAHADGLNWTQRGELFMKGTVTDQKTHQTWDVILVPGIDNINDDAAHGFKALGRAEETLGTKEFWQEVGDSSKDGVLFSKDVIEDQWLKGIKGDFNEAVQENQSIQPGEIGSAFSHIASWAWFTIKAVARTVWAPVGVAGGVAYSAVTPVALVAGQSAGSIVFDGAVRGAAVPAVLYVWNGVSWVGDSIGNVPTQDSFFVHLEYDDPSSGQQQDLVIDERGFDTLVQASVLEAMTDAQKAALQAKIDATEAEIQKEVQPLQQQEQNYSKQQGQADSTLESNPAQQQLEALLSQAMQSSQVTLSSDAQSAYLDQAKLRQLVVNYLSSLGVTSPDPQMVDSIVQKIGQTLQAMHAQMNPAPAPAPSPSSSPASSPKA